MAQKHKAGKPAAVRLLVRKHLSTVPLGTHLGSLLS